MFSPVNNSFALNSFQFFKVIVTMIEFRNIHEVSFSTIGFLEIVLHAFAQNNNLVRIFHSIFFALVDKLRAKS